MKVRVISVGKIKESYIMQGINEFTKRLQRHVDLEVIEVKDEKIGGSLSSAEVEGIKKEEGQRILERLDARSYTIALDPQGKHMSSEGLAKSISNLQVQGYSSIEFIIGGALGLHKSVRDRSDYILSFSHMTFTHQMARLILLEQVYRAFKIIKGEPYHI
ncbi:23S rRNA (pseudouridine(1915)-N(3))-methyltransferase RlmH [Halonatronum saccharophilum]|uniref:23S rRNA (pseudouridine(1915)-N(3))-methyltransferase RlmH n=1 Tax=Halonatronum saccharophilum TaxID=150060 RepID=UPI000480072A|nr:23S rRNA (pseudouridine(1915)-N(3))-methyltransferase RlmH [Halonatronum saccharophilum]